MGWRASVRASVVLTVPGPWLEATAEPLRLAKTAKCSYNADHDPLWLHEVDAEP
jgi:hypothetical protein